MNLEKGNIFTILLGLIAVIGLIAVSAYNTISGPLRSQVNTQLLNEAQTQAIINLRTAAFEAPYVDDDCDSDGHVEPRAFTTTTGNAPTGGGIFASTSGAKQNDPWGNPYGLCVWDIGSASDDAGCGGPSANRLDGTDDHTAGDKVTQTVLAVISAGPDRTFSTTCSAYSDATTNVITTSGDDMVQRFSYLEAASSGDWVTTAGGGGGSGVETVFYDESPGRIAYTKSGGYANTFMGRTAGGTTAGPLIAGYDTDYIQFQFNNSGDDYIIMEGDASSELSSYTSLSVSDGTTTSSFPFMLVDTFTSGSTYTQVYLDGSSGSFSSGVSLYLAFE